MKKMLKAFTLIEVLIVLAIIVILVALMLPAIFAAMGPPPEQGVMTHPEATVGPIEPGTNGTPDWMKCPHCVKCHQNE